MASPSQYKDSNYKVEHVRFFLDAARQKNALLLITSVKVEVKNLYMWPCLHLLSNGLCFPPFP